MIMFCTQNAIIVPKLFGDWTNEGKCAGTGDDPNCGPGTQHQKRTCTDGTVDKCTATEKQRTVTCTIAGTQLPACRGKYTILLLSLGRNVMNTEV